MILILEIVAGSFLAMLVIQIVAVVLGGIADSTSGERPPYQNPPPPRRHIFSELDRDE